MGAEDYLTKPVNPVLLNARINASLEKKRLRDQQRELISKFATKEVAEDLLMSGFALGGKHVDASAMFCDIRSFTTISESREPAETIELLNDYYLLMMDAITGEGGIVNQMVGDGLMSIFGAPVPREDHRQAAVLAARQMVELIRLFNAEQAARGKIEIEIGVGIASGRMVAGYTGTHDRATYTCVGDTVNVAARLEAHTKECGRPILIDENTRQGIDAGIPVESQGELLMKGKSRADEGLRRPCRRGRGRDRVARRGRARRRLGAAASLRRPAAAGRNAQADPARPRRDRPARRLTRPVCGRGTRAALSTPVLDGRGRARARR